MDKTQEEQEIEKKISQYQNRQKILLNKKRTEEHRARTHRLIGRGAILEAVFPAVVGMEGEEVKAFLIALSTGKDTSISLASWASLDFSICSTAFQRVERS